jgi:glycogen synthase
MSFTPQSRINLQQSKPITLPPSTNKPVTLPPSTNKPAITPGINTRNFNCNYNSNTAAVPLSRRITPPSWRGNNPHTAITPQRVSTQPVVTQPNKPSVQPTFVQPVVTQPNKPSVQPTFVQPHILPLSNAKINANKEASQRAIQESLGVEQKLNAFQQFLTNEAHNPKIATNHLISRLQQLVGLDTYRQICKIVAGALCEEKTSEKGELLLKENFQLILQVKDEDARNPLEGFRDHLRAQYDNLRAIAQLNDLDTTLRNYKEFSDKQSDQELVTKTNLLVQISMTKNRATEEFKRLPHQAIGLLCRRIWELDGGDLQAPADHGYRTALADIMRLLDHKGSSPIATCFEQLENQRSRGYSYATAWTQPIAKLPTDDNAISSDVNKAYHLEELNRLMKYNKSNPALVSHYEKSDPDLKGLIGWLIWVAYRKPMNRGDFGGDTLKENMGLLRIIQNNEGAGLIDQLTSHYSAKIKAQRIIKEIEKVIPSTAMLSLNKVALLTEFNKLSPETKTYLRYKVWYDDGGKADPHFGKLTYGEEKIEGNPYHALFGGTTPSRISTYLTELKQKVTNADRILKEGFEKSQSSSEQPIDLSAHQLTMERDLIKKLPSNYSIAVVTAEFEKIANVGGLAPAVDGMVRAFGPQNARVIMPLYKNGPISQEVVDSTKQTKYKISVENREISIKKAIVNGIKVYFIEDDSVFWVEKKDGATGSLYAADNYFLKYHRWAVFQKAAADLSYQLSKKKKNPVQLVHCHDAQTALVPKLLKRSHPGEWASGETPVTVFTYHNTSDPMLYRQDGSEKFLEAIGLEGRETNSFIEGIDHSDLQTTVSEQFAKESITSNTDFSNGLHDTLLAAAKKNTLFGINNGNPNARDPSKSEMLRTWVSCLPETLGQTVDLTFSPKMSNEELREKTRRIQCELCAYLKQLGIGHPAYADLNPARPIVFYFGRYDSGQKMDKLKLIMEETLKNGGQFVCIGSVADNRAKDILENMRKTAPQLAHKGRGFLILEDSKQDGKFVHQSKFIDLMLAACMVPVFPSRFEPFGFVQGELNLQGKRVMATKTGGFVDTLNDQNGYLFERMPNWDSTEQDEAIKTTLRKALADASQDIDKLYNGTQEQVAQYIERMRTIMQNALCSTWNKRPKPGDTTPIQYMELAYAKAFELRKLRQSGGINNTRADLNVLKI